MIFTWLFGQWRTIGMVALSTVLIYLSTVGAVRVSERRTLAEMSTFDFVVAVAIGAIVGRTATTPSPSYVQGVVAVLTLAAAHRCVGWARMRWAGVRQVMEREPLVVVLDGRLCPAALRRGHLTEADLAAAAREHGLSRLDQAHLMVMEANGRFSVIRSDQPPLDGPLSPELRHAPPC
ncbi:MAG TPA: YetF domain-containing protein [Acidimicrobiales bacterium]|jgi:uncharacterized membrane protein YcaP (DUF421 family)|nr:YetF domain-containing protein [Acidimicrobiales bacterium]